MKLLLVMGGLLGFGIGFIFSWAEQSSGASCIWHACLAAYLTAWLMRWWGTAWRKSLVDAMHERQNSPSTFAPGALLSKANKS